MLTFNFYEGVLWIAISLILFVITYRQALKNQQKLFLIAGILFLTFGISDFAEIYFNILPWWLWLWKIVNFIGLLVISFLHFKTKK